MNPEIKTRWVTALLSGKYKQGAGYLNENDRFCCLGVLCDVVKDELKIDWYENPEDEDFAIFDGKSQFLPKSVSVYAGLGINDDVRVPFIYDPEDGEVMVPLSELNDEGISFIKIAELIEENL